MELTSSSVTNSMSLICPTETQAKAQMTQLSPLTEVSGTISQNFAEFKCEKDRNALTCNLNKMMVIKVARLDKNLSIATTDQKYVILFCTKLQIGNDEIDVSYFNSDLN